MAPASKIVNPILYTSVLQNYRHTIIIITTELTLVQYAFTESRQQTHFMRDSCKTARTQAGFRLK